MVNLKSCSHGLTPIHSQKKPRLHFGESFTLTSRNRLLYNGGYIFGSMTPSGKELVSLSEFEPLCIMLLFIFLKITCLRKNVIEITLKVKIRVLGIHSAFIIMLLDNSCPMFNLHSNDSLLV